MTSGPLLTTRPSPLPPEVGDRLRGWVRAVLALDADEVVTITQLACPDNACAPVETVLTVLRPGRPLSRAVPLPAARVGAADVLSAFTRIAPDGPEISTSCTGSSEVAPPGRSRAAAAPARPTSRLEDSKPPSG